MATAIAGNDSFTKVEGMSAHLSELNVSDVKVSNLDVQGNAVVGNVVPTASGTYATVVGYAPSDFATMASGDVLNLLTSSGEAAATAVADARLLHLPASAIVTRVIVSNNGTAITGGASYAIGATDVATGINGAAVTTLMAATAETVIDTSPVVVGGPTGTTAAALGAAGTAQTVSELAGLAVAAVDNLVNVTSSVAATTAGDLRVEITYRNA